MKSDLFLPDLGRARLSPQTRTFAIATAGLLAILVVAAGFSNSASSPKFDAFLPICVTLWFAAQSLTALLLFGQFYITRSIGFAIYACMYEFAAFLMLPYLASLPGIAPSLIRVLADRQMTGALWATWHLVFPLLVVCGLIFDPMLVRRAPARMRVGRTLAAMATATVFLATAAVALLWLMRHAFPILMSAGHPTAFYRFELAPTVAIANGFACGFALVRGKHVTLGVWLALATFAAMLDAIVNVFSAHSYSFAWYVAIFETTLTASVVLAMLVLEIASLYRRLADLATRDSLTGLRNRRGLEEYLSWVFDYARRRQVGFGLLVVDIDHFKRYNDRYGHLAGDLALRRVAALLRNSTIRRYDLAARYGGEEFVLAIFDANLPQTIAVARRLQERLETAQIAHAGVESGRLSVSIGIAHNAQTPLEGLFAAADRALFRAKERGRNRYVVGDSIGSEAARAMPAEPTG